MNNVVHKSSGLENERKRVRTEKLVMILGPLLVLLYFLMLEQYGFPVFIGLD